MSDIRKWFMKKHKEDDAPGDPPKSTKAAAVQPTKPPVPNNPIQGGQDNSARRKTSKYFATAATGTTKEVSPLKNAREKSATENTTLKRKDRKGEEILEDIKPSSVKKHHKHHDVDDEDEDFVLPKDRKKPADIKPPRNLKGIIQDTCAVEEGDDNDQAEEHTESPVRPGGRGRGAKGSGTAAGGRGRGGGRGGFMNFIERKDPPRKGEKEVPEGAPGCLDGFTFVISGTLDSLEREEAEDLIKRHGGRVTGSVSKKTNFLLADEDIGGRKSAKAKELGTVFLTEDGLFDMIRKSKPMKVHVQVHPEVKNAESDEKSKLKRSKHETKGGLLSEDSKKLMRPTPTKVTKQSGRAVDKSLLTWTEQYKPKVTNDIVGNQSVIKQLHEWLACWNEQFLQDGQKKKGRKQNDNASKKAVLISGSPGIGKSTSAKLVSQMLGFHAIEVNASDSRGKADSNISKGISGSTANSIKELVSNESMSFVEDRSKHKKSVLIMDEVDGMSAGDRGGVADLIASIKISKIPIICICNDRYSQKLKSLVNHCLLLNFRKPTKQQMAKRLKQIAEAECLQVNEIALEELSDRVNGDMRMALNQLQYMSLSKSVIKYDDIRARLLISAKDEDISPFAAVDKLFGFNGGKLHINERIDLSMSDPDLLPLIVQENFINYRPVSAGKDENGLKRMNLIARAAESIADADIFNVQIRRYRQWQLSQASSFASTIIPAALVHGNREILEQGERNFNRFGGWLGKNSTMGKNLRLLEDVHVHILASQCNVDRETLRVDYCSLLLKQLTSPLRELSKEDAVQMVVELMDSYSLSQEDFDTLIELSKFQGHPNPMDGIAPAVKAALTRAYKQGSSNRVVRAADLITLPGFKKAPKKRISAILEPVESSLPEENGGTFAENAEDSSDGEDKDEEAINGTPKPNLDLRSDKSKGIQVQLDLKNNEKSNTKKTPAGKSAGAVSAAKGGGRGSSGVKRKR